MTHFVTVRLLEPGGEMKKKRRIGSPHNLQDSIFNLIHLPQYNSFHSHVVQSNVF